MITRTVARFVETDTRFVAHTSTSLFFPFSYPTIPARIKYQRMTCLRGSFHTDGALVGLLSGGRSGAGGGGGAVRRAVSACTRGGLADGFLDLLLGPERNLQ